MSKPGFLARMKAKSQERASKKFAERYKAGYEYAAGRLLSQGEECTGELCSIADGTFNRTTGEQQFDDGVKSAVRDFDRMKVRLLAEHVK